MSHNRAIQLACLAFTTLLIGCADTRETVTPTISSPQQTVVILSEPIRPITIPADQTRPPELPTYELSADGTRVIVTLRYSNFFQTPIPLSLRQKFLIVPVQSVDFYNWSIHFDSKFLYLESPMDSQYPSPTGWRWTPRVIGTTIVELSGSPKCLGSTPPCSIPGVGAKVPVEIVP